GPAAPPAPRPALHGAAPRTPPASSPRPGSGNSSPRSRSAPASPARPRPIGLVASQWRRAPASTATSAPHGPAGSWLQVLHRFQPGEQPRLGFIFAQRVDRAPGLLVLNRRRAGLATDSGGPIPPRTVRTRSGADDPLLQQADDRVNGRIVEDQRRREWLTERQPPAEPAAQLHRHQGIQPQLHQPAPPVDRLPRIESQQLPDLIPHEFDEQRFP